MPSPEITNYIIQNLQLGYDVSSIRESLLKSGYTTNQVNAALDYVSAQQGTNQQQWSQTQSHMPQGPKPIAFFAILIFLAVGIGFFVIFSSVDSPSVTQPNPSYQQQYDQTRINDNTASNTKPPLELQDAQQTNTGNTQNTVDTTQTQSRNQQATTRLSRLEIDERVNEISATQPEEAIKLCKQIITTAGKFTCITKVAFDSETPPHCEHITHSSAKDTCYINFAINEIADDSVCQKIVNDIKRGSCYNVYDTLKQLANLPPAQEITDEQLAQYAAQSQLSEDEAIEAGSGSAFGNPEDVFDDEPVAA